MSKNIDLFHYIHFFLDVPVKTSCEAWNTLCDFCLDFPPILQSEQVDASWGKSEPVCRLQLTDSTENLVVYYGHRLLFFSFRLLFHPVGRYQTCLIFSVDFRTHMFSFVMCLLATRCTFLHEFVVIGTTLKSGSVWSSDTVYDAQFSFVTIYKVGKCVMPSVLKICSDFKSCVVYSSL